MVMERPKPGKVVADLAVFTEYVCGDAPTCPHQVRCMEQAIDPDAKCFVAMSRTGVADNLFDRAWLDRGVG